MSTGGLCSGGLGTGPTHICYKKTNVKLVMTRGYFQ